VKTPYVVLFPVLSAYAIKGREPAELYAPQVTALEARIQAAMT
jgi:hypothetical protein